MSSEKEIAKYIETGDVSLALRHVKGSTKPPQDRAESSFRLLKKVYGLCYKFTKESKKFSSSDVDNVYELTRILCQNISSTWSCNRLVFMQCLYHINNYLVKHNPMHARKLCEFFFQLKSSSWDATWDPNEYLIVANLVHDFIAQVTDRYLNILCSAGDDSLSSWLDFTFRLFELNDLRKLYKLFSVLDTIWVKVYHHCKEKLVECVSLCLSKLGQWFKTLKSTSTNAEITVKDVSCFFSLVDRVLILSMNDVSSLLDILLTCTANFKIPFPQHEEDVDILTNCFKFYTSVEKPFAVVESFDNTYSTIMERTSKRSLALPTVVVFTVKLLPSILVSSVLIESRVLNISKLLLELMFFSQKESDTPSSRSKMITDLSYCALSVIAAPAVPKDSLIAVFPQLKTYVKQFIKAIPDAGKQVNISIGVSAILSVVLAFKKVERFEEPMWLCRYVLFIFLKIDPNLLWEDFYYKNYVTTWLSNTVTAYSKCNLGVDAQVMLIVFAAYQPKYTMSTMRAWATLKNCKVQSIKMDATVLDVLNVNGIEIEKQFPHFVLTDVNLDLLLLGEIYGYTKLRELRTDCVLVVYKTAAKTVKDLVTLAHILCCTVEAFSIDTSNTLHLNKLDASLNNMIKHLQENGIKSEHDFSVVQCTIGNLFYQKARLEIQRTRQKSEVEVAQNEQWNSKKKIPVFRAGEKDDFDMTEVDLVGSNFKLGQNSDVFSLLMKAMDYWKLAEESLTLNIMLEPTLSYVKGAGYLTRMHRYFTLETKCWNLLYKIASKLDSFKYQVLAAAELLFSCKSVDSSITSKIDNVLQNPKRFDRKSYVNHLYRISYARNLLFHGKVEECRQALEKIEVQAVLPYFLVNAQLIILKSFLDVECPKDETPLLPFVKLFENILYLIKNNAWDTFNEACVVQCLMIDVSTLLGTIYSDLKCVRRARLYTKAELRLVQRLALPVRVCEFMTLKCWVDLLTWNITDSDLNAQEVENMLDLGVLKTEFPSKMDSGISQGSMIKCVPHFLNQKECFCYQCMSMNYPSLVLNAIVNRILILIGNGARQEAHNVINVGLSVVEIVQQKKSSFNSLWTPFSSSVARFYYVLARTNVLWKKYKEGIHYANLACNLLQSEPVKNHGLIASSKQIILETKCAQNYVEPIRIVPVSRRFTVNLDETAITPEAQKYTDSKPWDSTANNRKTAPTGYLTHRKSLFNKNLEFGVPDDADEEISKEIDCFALEGLSPVSNHTVKTAEGKNQTESKLGVPTIVVSRTPEDRTFFGKRLGGGDAASKFDGSHKLQLGMAALNLKDADTVTPVAKRTGRKAALISSSIKTQTEKKTRPLRANLFNSGSIGPFAKMASTTPAIKVFYDPEGVEHSTNKTKRNNKTKEGAGTKRTTRLTALSKAVRDEKFGTPTASRTVRTAKGKLTFDDVSDNELELVVAAPKKNQGRKKNGLGKKCVQDDVEIGAASMANGKSDETVTSKSECTAKMKLIAVDDESAINSYRNELSMRRHDGSLQSKQLPTTLSQVRPSKSKKNITVETGSKSTVSDLSNSNKEKPIAALSRKMLDGEGDERIQPPSWRSIHDDNTINQSLATKKCTMQAKSKSSASGQPISDESEDESVAAPFRKMLDMEGNERIRPSRRLIHDETTINQSQAELISKSTASDQSNPEESEDEERQVVVSSRKVLDRKGNEEIQRSRRLMHDDATISESQAKKKSTMQTKSKPKAATPVRLTLDELEDETIAVPFRKMLDMEGNERIRPSKRLIHDETTINQSQAELISKSNASDQSNPEESEDEERKVVVSSRKVLDRKGNEKIQRSRRLMHDDPTVSEFQAKKKSTMQTKSKPKAAASVHLTLDESEDETIAVPFRKMLDMEGNERIRSSRRLIHDETTINQSQAELISKSTASDQSNSDESEGENGTVAAPFRKILNRNGNERIQRSRRLIHDDTTINQSTTLSESSSTRLEVPLSSKQSDFDDSESMDSSDLIESSIVQTTPPRSGRKCVDLTPISISDQMSQLTLATRSSKKRGPLTTPQISRTRKPVK